MWYTDYISSMDIFDFGTQEWNRMDSYYIRLSSAFKLFGNADLKSDIPGIISLTQYNI